MLAQAALIICGLAIRDFDNSRTRKQGKPQIVREKTQFQPKLMILVFKESKFFRSITPANNEENLYYYELIIPPVMTKAFLSGIEIMQAALVRPKQPSDE